jgi:hypothetical protein
MMPFDKEESYEYLEHLVMAKSGRAPKLKLAPSAAMG